MTHLIYQAIADNDVKHEAETLAKLHNNILNREYDTLPDFSVQLVDLDNDSEVLAFNHTVFLKELQEAFDESVMEAHYSAQHNRSNRS